jgi:hypothetical protein
MAQTSYSDTLAPGFAGQLADLSFKRVSTGVNAQGAQIPFGVAVTKATGDGKYDLPNAAGDKVYGIALHSHDVDQLGLTDTNGIPIDGDFNLLEEGVAYVITEEAVVDGDPVYVRYATGAGGTQLGGFRKSAVTSETAIVKGAKFRSTAAAGGIAAVSFSQLVNLS